MGYRIKLSELTFFKYLTPLISKEMVSYSRLITFNKDDMIILYGENISGLYIVLEGKVGKYTQGFKTLIDIYDQGCSIGEVSLLSAQPSFFGVRAEEDNTKVLLLERDKFSELLSKDFVFSAAFYKGASLTMARQLQSIYQKIDGEIKSSKQAIREIIEKNDILKKLAKTRSAISETGENVFFGLADILPLLTSIKHKFSGSADLINQISKNINKIIETDSQNFDIISQQIDLINFYLLNIQRSLSDQSIVEIKGDQHIFEIQANDRIHDDIEFF